MINKLIVIGIDGMDFDLVKKYEDKLPTLSKMLKENNYPRLRSVFPADTTPAWSTIYTGVDPTVHGIINFVNVKDRDNSYKPFEFDDSAFKGKTFWDKLNEMGFSTTVLLPMNIKQGWGINGTMITRPYKGEMHVFPKSKESLYNPKISILGTEAKFTSEAKLDFLKKDFFAKSDEEFRLTKLAIENENCDFLFSYFSTTDGLCHDFWRHCDENHPEYPGENEHKNAIRDLYIKMDNHLAEIISMCPDTPLLVLSDHGHGARPVYIARVNEMLHRFGYLEPKTGASGSKKKKKSLKGFIKKFALNFVARFGLPKWAVKIARKVPVWKGIFASGNDFDWDKTVAYLSDLSALKNYSYGGIRVIADDDKKDALCDEIIEKLKTVMIDENTPAFTWIKRTNTHYHGEYLNRYPEIIFQLDEMYGADWNLGEELFEKKGFMHRLSPGAHRYETAVIASKGIILDKPQYEMTDVRDIILSVFK
ncbi:MAG: alkaline phosphatase family protein [Ruminococcus sp.]|nr:alkaline phosphatase family protein [Ruminococcus sp.]